ncbi:endo-1,4-beta-xylanase [Sphingomonas canadensis]|uniref:Beta-xylanase n=1 Tax=Sphingomonas canadensis TaxID=1219257 RepID=A0ABW3H3V2_9SPHN|nr:endo-1,4-beta-xylanase [Sphingomonas canadensis]MCW3835706.1 endo-1,4-beta-xylanase [Sphingomonas canadensis]
MTRLTRRTALAAGGIAALTAGAGRALAMAQGEPGLNAVAKTRGLRFGSCVSWSQSGADRASFANPAYAALLERDCGVLVAENEFKWQALRPDAKTFDVERFADMIDYAEAKGMAMRGHTLFWHKTERFPRWLLDHDFGADPKKEATRLLTQHIKTVGKLYAGRIASFDVVNETVDDQTGALRESNVSKAMGGTEAMLDLAFHTARAAAPDAELVYNDYMSWEPGQGPFRSGVLKMLEAFRKRGVPCDTLGLQSHIWVGNEPTARLVGRQESDWRAFLDEVVGMGYRLAITEFDVNDAALPADIATRDRAIADYSKAYLDICLSYTQLKDVLAWGMCDKYTWLNGFSPRKDKAPMRATPYDAAFKPKPLYTAIRQALAAAPAR